MTTTNTRLGVAATCLAMVLLAGCDPEGEVGDPCVQDQDCMESSASGAELGCLPCQRYIDNGTPTCGAVSVLASAAVSPQYIAQYCTEIGAAPTPEPTECEPGSEEEGCVTEGGGGAACTTDSRYQPYGDIQIDSQCQTACIYVGVDGAEAEHEAACSNYEAVARAITTGSFRSCPACR